YDTEVDAGGLEDIQTRYDGIVAACNDVAEPSGKIFEAKEHKLNVRAVGNGKTTAQLLDKYLRGMNGVVAKPLFESKAGRMDKEQLEMMRIHNENREILEPAEAGSEWNGSQNEAGRCLHCDCRKRTTCRLRKYATDYGVEMRKFSAAELPAYNIIGREGDIILEPGKCIKCGLCVEIAKKYGEDIGLTFIGRGFDMEIQVPFGKTLDQGIKESAAECIAACPTAAIAWRRDLEADRGHTTSWAEL
ncbi:MAG: hypothetical protein KJ052_14210, partial [Candidatus Hydrogenedentes bacterium]|nr:hypothetical protein [Candidatus Hydrogenedentota bacterium]